MIGKEGECNSLSWLLSLAFPILIQSVEQRENRKVDRMWSPETDKM